jgi:hypothetical protein
MRKLLTITAMAIVLFTFCACQPTPTTMDSSSYGSLKIEDDADNVRCEQHLELDDDIQLVISASVFEPKGDFHKGNLVWQAIDSSFVEKVSRALSTNSIYYKALETRSELTSAITTYCNQLDLVRDKISSEDVRMLEGIISNMQTALTDSLETEPVITLDDVMVETEAKIQTGEKNKAVLVLGSSNRKEFIRITNFRWKDIMFDQPASSTISSEAALQNASGILQKLGLADEFSLAAIKSTSSEYTLVANIANQSGIGDYQADKRIELVFTRNIGGQNQVFSQQIEDGTTGREYDETVFWELIKMEFDNNGLVEFVWQQPCSITLDPEEIHPIDLTAAVNAMCQFMSNSQNQYVYSPLGIDPRKVNITVDKIELGMTCILGPDKTFLVIPVWEFYGNVAYVNDNGEIKYVSISGLNAGQILDEPEVYNSLCTINALTGKRIDRTQGY